MRHATVIMALAILVAGCGPTYPEFEFAAQVADALKERGVAWETSSRISFGSMKHARIDEGLALEAEGLRVEVIRITDQRTYNIMGSAVALSGAMGALLDEEAEQPPQVYRSQPFVVVVRKEPNPGAVMAVVETILPRDETK